MTFTEGDLQVLTFASLIGAAFATGKAFDALLTLVISSLENIENDVVHYTVVSEGNRTIVMLFHKNGSGVERTTDTLGSLSAVRERTFLWRSDDRGVPREWERPQV
jgi:hypothetical protein